MISKNFNILSEITKNAEEMKDKYNTVFFDFSDDIIIHKSLSIMHKFYVRMINTWRYYELMEKESIISEHLILDRIGNQMSDVVWMFTEDISNILEMERDLANSHNKNEKLEKTLAYSDPRTRFLKIIRDASLHYSKTKNFSSSDFLDSISNFNNYFLNQKNNWFKNNEIGTMGIIEEGWPLLTDEDMIKIMKLDDRLLTVEAATAVYDVTPYLKPADSKEIIEEINKGLTPKLQCLTENFYCPIKSKDSFNDVNKWVALIQVTDRTAIVIKMYPFLYLCFNLLSTLYTERIEFLSNAKKSEE